MTEGWPEWSPEKRRVKVISSRSAMDYHQLGDPEIEPNRAEDVRDADRVQRV